jgi:hypothetical protein
MSSALTPGKKDVRREGRANSLGAQASLPAFPENLPCLLQCGLSGRPGKLPVCPILFRGVTDDVLATSSDRLADRLE